MMMTREEMITNLTLLEDTGTPMSYNSCKFIVNKIYDVFESKTCSNCTYYTGTVCYFHEGWHDAVGVVHPTMRPTDGCNNFKKEDNK